MYCPECKSEYEKGVTRCSECDVDLVESLDNNTELISIYESIDSALLSDVVARVEAAGVPYLVQSGTAFDYPNQSQSSTWRGVLWIPEQNTEDVRAMIEEAEKTFEAGSVAEEPSSPE